MHITIFTDGGSLNNPGPAASAFLIYKDGFLLKSSYKKLGTATNNVAEYNGLIMALEELIKISDSINWADVQKITTISDSQLMVNQLNGEYKIKNHDIRTLANKVNALKTQIPVSVLHTHVLREKNEEADALVKKALGR